MATQASTQSGPIALPRERVASAGRILMIDALRGIALLFMALDHAAFFMGAGFQAESYGGHPVALQSPIYWLSGMLTNLASPIFWLLSGVSLALLESSQRAKQVSELAITRFMLIRAAVILVLDLTICNMVWLGSTPYVHVLTTIAIAMALLSVLRFLPNNLLTGLALIVLFGYQAWLTQIGPRIDDPQSLVQAIWLTYSYDTNPAIGFPILGWGTLMWLGFVFGRHMSLPILRLPRTWTLIGIALIVVWLVLRLLGGYGDFGPDRAAEPWYYLLIMSKAPPSLTYLAFNLGLAALLLAVFAAWPALLERRLLHWLVVIGQTSLFFYVTHLIIYHILAQIGALIPHPKLPNIIWGYLGWSIGLLALIPLAQTYRTVRKRYPKSILRYF